MTELTVRPPAAGEEAAVADLFNEIALAAYGTKDTTEDEVRLLFTSPDVDRERDIRVVAAEDGRLVGYGDLWAQAGKIWLDLREHPSLGTGTGAEAALAALLPRASELAAAESLDPLILRAWVPTEEHRVKAVLERTGFEVVRHSVRMEIELGEDLPEPGWPEGVAVRAFEAGQDERLVYDVQNEAFADVWEYAPLSYEEWTHFMVHAADFNPALWFLATADGTVVGAALCRSHEPGDPELGWIRVLCVRPPWRRRGVAIALLQHAFRELTRGGRLRAGLNVDAESTTGALELYERAGMRIARRTDIYERELA